MRPSRRTMPKDEFWQLIDVLGGSVDEPAVERLTEALRAAGKRKAVSFQERLAVELYELDRETLCRQSVRWSDDPDDEDPVPLSDDSFLYLRAGIVAQGRRVVEQVLADPAVLATRRWDDGELVLYVAGEVAGDEIETTFSYESGSNRKHWSDLPAPAEEAALDPVQVKLSGSDPVRALGGGTFYNSTTHYGRTVAVPRVAVEASDLLRRHGGWPAPTSYVIVWLVPADHWNLTIHRADGPVDWARPRSTVTATTPEYHSRTVVISKDDEKTWPSEDILRAYRGVVAYVLLDELASTAPDHPAVAELQRWRAEAVSLIELLA